MQELSGADRVTHNDLAIVHKFEEVCQIHDGSRSMWMLAAVMPLSY